MIRVGDMVAIVRTQGRNWYEEKYAGLATVLEVDEAAPDTTERLAFVLRPDGKTRWEFLCNLEAVT